MVATSRLSAPRACYPARYVIYNTSRPRPARHARGCSNKVSPRASVVIVVVDGKAGALGLLIACKYSRDLWQEDKQPRVQHVPRVLGVSNGLEDQYPTVICPCHSHETLV